MNKISLQNILNTFLTEDINHADITSEAIFPNDYYGSATLITKEDGIFSGAEIISLVYMLLDNRVSVTLHKVDGDPLQKYDEIATVHGPVRSILSGERVVLNLIQRMSGIATITHQAVSVFKNTPTKIVDTRKTLPGLRMLDKYAVTCGGGYNHRHGLYDGVMIKDNHIAFAGSITNAVELVRQQIGPMVKIEVEAESEAQVIEAVKNSVDIIMFDNQSPEEIIALKKLVPHHILTEASGGITANNLIEYQNTNVDLISLGYLTHSVRALDISLLMKEEKEID